mgnify:FL=1
MFASLITIYQVHFTPLCKHLLQHRWSLVHTNLSLETPLEKLIQVRQSYLRLVCSDNL